MPITRTPRLARVAVATLGGVAIAATALAPVGSEAAPSAAPDPCPAAKRLAALDKGDPVTSYTVSTGTVPDELTGQVVGVLDDGIAPGIDMIMVKLAGSRVTHVGGRVDAGIWAGMSGSPVYAANGRLIGAVSYGLSWSPSQYAGVTPARAMYDVMGGADGPARSARAVDVPAAVERQLARDGVPDPDRQRYTRLPVPITVSGGLSAKRFHRVADRAGGDIRLVPGGRRASGRAAEIVPGGNLAASVSYGDVTSAGVGTTTAVCDGEVLGFGHPMLWSGPSQLTMHGADALYVQRDTTFGSFKVANPTAPIGAVLQDRLAAIAGVLGDPPENTTVRSTTTFGDRSRVGRTHISVEEAVPYLTAIHALVNADVVYDGLRGGTSVMSWQITVRRESGKLVDIDRADLFANQFDITYESLWSVYDDLARVVYNDFEEVGVTRVRLDADYSERVRQTRMTRLEVRRGGEWQTVGNRDRVPARPGTRLHLRVSIEPTAGSDALRRVKRLDVRVPRTQANRGQLVVEGGESRHERPRGVQSFGALVRFLEGQSLNNSINATVSVGRGGSSKQRHDSVGTGSTVRGDKFVRLRILE